MPNFNKTIIIGHLSRDPETRNLSGDASVTNFSIGVNHTYKAKSGEKRSEATFIDCAAWNKTGEVIAQYVGKGDPLMVEGRLKQETWEDKTTGAKRSKLVLVVEAFQFLGGGNSEERPAGRSAPVDRVAEAKRRAADQPRFDPTEAEGAFTDDDLPF